MPADATATIVNDILAHASPSGRLTVLRFLAESIRWASANANDRWAISLWPDLIRFNVGFVHCINVQPHAIQVLVAGNPEVPNVVLEKHRYKMAGGSRLAVLPIAMAATALPQLRRLHEEAMIKAAVRRQQPQARKAHEQGVVEHVWKLLGDEGTPPVPAHFGTSRDPGRASEGPDLPASRRAVKPTYLFSWNPRRWPWQHLDESLETLAREGFVDEKWSCGNRRQLAPGSPAVLIRLGAEKPTGVIGLGTTRSAPHEGPHYTVPGKRAWFVDIRWHALQREPVIGWKDLQRPPFAGFRWGIEGSGVEVPEALAEAVRARWEARASVAATRSADELPPRTTYVEGSQKTITVNAFERDLGAREKCLEHYGHVCAVCEILLEDRYGEIARNFIHVHHVVPIATIRKSYEVDPIADLRPVCPNCHAILHRRDPPLTIEEARGLVRR